MSTETIERFLQTEYTDEKLAALLAHAEDGKLSFFSCCCFAGIPSATHTLQGERMHLIYAGLNQGHHEVDGNLFSKMSSAYSALAVSDEESRAKLIPLIRAEIARRDSLKQEFSASDLTEMSVLSGG